MKRMKKICGILLGAAILLTGLWSNPRQVQADAIAAPKVANPYLNTEVKGSIKLGFRWYKTNGPDGEVIVYKSPEEVDIVTKVKNGEKFKSQQAYEDKDGNYWIYYVNLKTEVIGWVRHDQLMGKDASMSFLEEYKDQIIEAGWKRDISLIGKKVYLWEYPGSTKGHKDVYPKSGGKTYVDEEGRTWGYTNTREWICLDAPKAKFKTLYPDGAPERGNVADGGGLFLAGFAWYDVAGIGVLIAAVVGVTLGLLKKLKEK